MTEGTYIEPLSLYLRIERSAGKISRIYFSAHPPDKTSALSEAIASGLSGRAPYPEVELDLSGFTPFQRRVFSVVQSIPRGKTMTYSEVAELAGSPGAARAVGQVMAANPFPIIVPCHRVVAKRGPGGFRWGTKVKKRLLEMERGEVE
jgi:methylated-DNA-[protein]-cysteine S-methyltransferase